MITRLAYLAIGLGQWAPGELRCLHSYGENSEMYVMRLDCTPRSKSANAIDTHLIARKET